MTYPKQHESIVRASYQALIENGVSPSLALLASEIMGRDAAGCQRTDRDMDYIRQVVAKLNSITIDELDSAEIMPLQTEVAA